MNKRKSAKSSVQNKEDQNGGHLAPFKLAKLLDPEASWDKDQLGDVLHWIRQIVALVCGLLWGAVPLVGGIWLVVFPVLRAEPLSSLFSSEIPELLISFLLISSGIIYGYYALILKVDEEEFGGHGPLLQEGLFASVTLFLLAWTLVYSLAHF